MASRAASRTGRGPLHTGLMTQYVNWVLDAAIRGRSPLLANVVLHYGLDLWVHRWRQRHARGKVIIVGYADNAVKGFQYETDLGRHPSPASMSRQQRGVGLEPLRS